MPYRWMRSNAAHNSLWLSIPSVSAPSSTVIATCSTAYPSSTLTATSTVSSPALFSCLDFLVLSSARLASRQVVGVDLNAADEEDGLLLAVLVLDEISLRLSRLDGRLLLQQRLLQHPIRNKRIRPHQLPHTVPRHAQQVVDEAALKLRLCWKMFKGAIEQPWAPRSHLRILFYLLLRVTRRLQ
eukprot:767119-Hanusia_phi.AAC.2